MRADPGSACARKRHRSNPAPAPCPRQRSKRCWAFPPRARRMRQATARGCTEAVSRREDGREANQRESTFSKGRNPRAQLGATSTIGAAFALLHRGNSTGAGLTHCHRLRLSGSGLNAAPRCSSTHGFAVVVTSHPGPEESGDHTNAVGSQWRVGACAYIDEVGRRSTALWRLNDWTSVCEGALVHTAGALKDISIAAGGRPRH